MIKISRFINGCSLTEDDSLTAILAKGHTEKTVRRLLLGLFDFNKKNSFNLIAVKPSGSDS